MKKREKKLGRPWSDESRAVRWERQPLGKMPDGVIARKLGVAPHIVRHARKNLGIKAFSWTP